jgi:ABC-type Fe3+-hydroxamate transport system substrate-binding protein
MAENELEKLYKIPDWDVPPKRVVSLIPSMTLNLFELGFGDSVVGITDYCTKPGEKLIDLPRMGGPKNADIEMIAAQSPDLVILSQEENSEKIVEGLLDKGISVWMIFPKTVEQSLDVLRSLLALYHTDAPVIKINTLQMAVDYANLAAETQPRVRYFSPIWLGEEQGLDWYMTFNEDTYMSDVLRMFGGDNIFSTRTRRYPLTADLGLEEPDAGDTKRDTRYPRVTAEEIVQAAPELILVPDDPYQFKDTDKERLFRLLSKTPAVLNNNVHFIDGSLIMWDGVMLGAALQQLPELFL